MKRMLISNGNPMEKIVGFSRAVRVGPYISVGGTAPVDHEGRTVGINDPIIQTHRCLEIIKEAIECAGGSLNDVVRTRIYVTDIKNWEEVGRAHGEVFEDILPATSMVEVSQLIDPDFLVEIEATAKIR